MEYYSAIKKNEILSFAERWVDWITMLSKIRKTQKAKYCTFLPICRPKINNNNDNNSYNIGT
jgi:hypothetical protein